MEKNFKALIEAGKKITSIVGYPEDVFSQLVGKTICPATQADYFRFKYLVAVKAVGFDKNTSTFIGDYDIDGKIFESSHTCGNKCIYMAWVIE